MTPFETAERLSTQIIEHLEADLGAMAVLDEGLGVCEQGTVNRFLVYAHDLWRASLKADREVRQLSERTRVLQEVCQEMLRIWEP